MELLLKKQAAGDPKERVNAEVGRSVGGCGGGHYTSVASFVLPNSMPAGSRPLKLLML